VEGRKSFILKYRFTGIQRLITIGRFGSPWTVEMARQEALRLLTEVASGRDPAMKAAGADLTVSDLWDLYVAEGCRHKKPSSMATASSRAKCHVLPLLGTRLITSLNNGDIERFAISVSSGEIAKPKNGRPGASPRGGRGAANQAVTLLKALLAFAVRRGFLTINPALWVRQIPSRPIAKTLPDEAIGRLAAAINRYVDTSGNIYAAAAIQLLLLIGARKNEILSLRWSDIDFERSIAHLPDSKTGPRVLFLSSSAISILRALPHVEGNAFVIIGAKPGDHLKGLTAGNASVKMLA
jgi:hypothetical protein